MNGHGLEKTSSPKLVVPMVRLHESGSASSTLSRWSSGSCTEPPVESWTTRSVASRSASTGVAGAARRRGSAGARRRGCARGSSPRRRPRSATRRLDELLERGRQLRAVGLGGLGAGRRDGDEGAHGRRWAAAALGSSREVSERSGELRGVAKGATMTSGPPRCRPRAGGRRPPCCASPGPARSARLVVPGHGRHDPTLGRRAHTSAPRSGRTCPDPSRWRNTSRRGGRPRLCTRATVSCPR